MSSECWTTAFCLDRSISGRTTHNTHTQIYNNYEDLLKQCQDVWMSLNGSSIRKMAIRKVVCLDYIPLHTEGCLEKKMQKKTMNGRKVERLIEFIFCVSFYKSLHVRFSFFFYLVVALASFLLFAVQSISSPFLSFTFCGGECQLDMGRRR